MPYAISAVITSYLRLELLAESIRSLCCQSLPGDQYEIFIADNAADAETQALVDRFQAEFPDRRLVWLPLPENNAALARNTAFQQADSPLIAFLDDDARAAPDWLESGLRCFSTLEGLDCAGGPILPFYTTPRPEWYKDQYATRQWGEQPRWLTNGESFSGSNMIWRKQVLAHIQGFNPRLGPARGSFSLGEDTSAFLRAWEDLPQPKFYYCPDLVVSHWVPAYKMTVAYILRRYLLNGQVHIRLMEPLSFSRRLQILIRSAGSALYYALRAILRCYRYRRWQNWVVEEGRRVLDRVGAACAAAGIWFNVRHG